MTPGFLDNARPELERTRADFHITHIVNANLIVELPFGQGKRFLNGPGLLEKIAGDWQVSSIIPFFNPEAGALGTLQRLQFDGPSLFAWDLSVIKRVRIGNYSVELRGDFFNVLNRPVFSVGDYNINSQNFGRMTGLEVAPRVVQVAAKLNF